MTIQDMIDLLNKCPDKQKKIFFNASDSEHNNYDQIRPSSTIELVTKTDKWSDMDINDIILTIHI